MKKKMDIRKKILKEWSTNYYSLGYLIGLGVRNSYFGDGTIVKVGKTYACTCTIKFDSRGESVKIAIDTLLDANSDWQLDLDLLEKIYTTFSHNVDTRRIERDELDERLSQLKAELEMLETRGTLADGSIINKKNDTRRKEDVVTLPTP